MARLGVVLPVHLRVFPRSPAVSLQSLESNPKTHSEVLHGFA